MSEARIGAEGAGNATSNPYQVNGAQQTLMPVAFPVHATGMPAMTVSLTRTRVRIKLQDAAGNKVMAINWDGTARTEAVANSDAIANLGALALLDEFRTRLTPIVDEINVRCRTKLAVTDTHHHKDLPGSQRVAVLWGRPGSDWRLAAAILLMAAMKRVMAEIAVDRLGAISAGPQTGQPEAA